MTVTTVQYIKVPTNTSTMTGYPVLVEAACWAVLQGVGRFRLTEIQLSEISWCCPFYMCYPAGVPYGTYIPNQRYSLVDGSPGLVYRGGGPGVGGPASCPASKQPGLLHSPNHQEGFYSVQVVPIGLPMVYTFFAVLASCVVFF